MVGHLTLTIFAEELDLGTAGGLRVAIKDTIDVAGLPTRSGSRALQDVRPAAQNAWVVARILEAGCRIVGKTTLHELAFGITGINDWAGTPINPNFPDLIPGGSSSGSAAAVAAGLVDFALGTDTGGSIRFPAACCGVWGLKPTLGKISRSGIGPIKTTLDCVGPLAGSLEMIVKAMTIIDSDFKSVSTSTARIGVVGVDAMPEILARRDELLAKTSLDCASVELPLLEAAFAAGLVIINAETFSAFGNLIPTGLLGRDVEARLQAAGGTTLAQIAEAEALRIEFTQQVDGLLTEFDALLLPTIGDPLPTIESARSGSVPVSLTRFVRPFNLSGHPALTFPCEGEDPISMQLVGPKGGESKLCAIASKLLQHEPSDKAYTA